MEPATQSTEINAESTTLQLCEIAQKKIYSAFREVTTDDGSKEFSPIRALKKALGTEKELQFLQWGVESYSGLDRNLAITEQVIAEDLHDEQLENNKYFFNNFITELTKCHEIVLYNATTIQKYDPKWTCYIGTQSDDLIKSVFKPSDFINSKTGNNYHPSKQFLIMKASAFKLFGSLNRGLKGAVFRAYNVKIEKIAIELISRYTALASKSTAAQLQEAEIEHNKTIDNLRANCMKYQKLADKRLELIKAQNQTIESQTQTIAEHVQIIDSQTDTIAHQNKAIKLKNRKLKRAADKNRRIMRANKAKQAAIQLKNSVLARAVTKCVDTNAVEENKKEDLIIFKISSTEERYHVMCRQRRNIAKGIAQLKSAHDMTDSRTNQTIEVVREVHRIKNAPNSKNILNAVKRIIKLQDSDLNISFIGCVGFQLGANCSCADLIELFEFIYDNRKAVGAI